MQVLHISWRVSCKCLIAGVATLAALGCLPGETLINFSQLSSTSIQICCCPLNYEDLYKVNSSLENTARIRDKNRSELTRQHKAKHFRVIEINLYPKLAPQEPIIEIVHLEGGMVESKVEIVDRRLPREIFNNVS